jgi:hypothetical protein
MGTLGLTLALLAAAATSPASPPSPTDLNLARAVFKELVELDTSQSAGETTTAAEAVAVRLRAAGVPAADVQVVGPTAHK